MVQTNDVAVAEDEHAFPIVAVLVGYFLGGEELTTRTILGSLCILVSVIVITTMPAKKPAAAAQLKSAVETAGS